MAQSRLHPLSPHPLTIVPGGLSIEEEGAAGQGHLPPGLPHQHSGHIAPIPGHPAGHTLLTCEVEDSEMNWSP